MRTPWYKQLHWQILTGLVLGLLFGIGAAGLGGGKFVSNWVAPFGTIFMNLLRLVAIPLILASIVSGIVSLADPSSLTRIGGRSIALYLSTTVVALIIGLTLVNLVQPGNQVPDEVRDRLIASYEGDAATRTQAAQTAAERGPLQPLVDLVPLNALQALSNNSAMLQVLFMAVLIGLGLLYMPRAKAQPLIGVFDSLSVLVIKVVDFIMLTAPVGVFALMASTITSIAGDDPSQVLSLLTALAWYAGVVVIGLALHTFGTYRLLLRFFAPHVFNRFVKSIAPAQLVAFSTSSSGATLPVTMEVAEERIGISKEVSSFVLPMGATINMDGTALYQAVAAVFIAQTLGMELGLAAQLQIILMAVLASIGTAAVPSAGIVMLVVILETVNVPAAGIALILGIDRPLDMLRTVTNVTGDLTVATIVAAKEDAILSDEALGELQVSRGTMNA